MVYALAVKAFWENTSIFSFNSHRNLMKLLEDSQDGRITSFSAKTTCLPRVLRQSLKDLFHEKKDLIPETVLQEAIEDTGT